MHIFAICCNLLSLHKITNYPPQAFKSNLPMNPKHTSLSSTSTSPEPANNKPPLELESELKSELTEYEQLLRKIYFISNVKKDLHNITQLNNILKQPLDDPSISIVHVAGTNGKGSVCLKIAKTLELAGYKVGLLVSPHISSYRERMSINGKLITESDVTRLLRKIFDIMETHPSQVKPTFFEITTALSFLYFQENGVDVVVLETGLGGLLDATNVIAKPVLSVITSIGLEHTAILGNTVELIAEHKAGIIKEGCPALVGPNVPHATIRRVAKERLAEGYYTCQDVLGDEKDSSDDDNVNDNTINNNNNNNNNNKVMIQGTEYVDYDKENSRTARAAVILLGRKHPSKFSLERITPEIIQEGIAQRPPCRFEEIITDMDEDHSNDSGTTRSITILDIAHNPPAMKTLVAKLQATHPSQNKRFVVGFSADKNISEIGNLLLSVVPDPSYIHLVEAVNLRAAKLEEIFSAVPQLKNANSLVKDRSITAQVKCAREIADSRGEVMVVCGSVFLMAEARKALGVEEARDSDNITKVAGKGLMQCKEKLMASKTSGNDL